jgi:hypothetical protein
MEYYEKQYFTQWWLWLIMLTAAIPLFLIALYNGPVLRSDSVYSMSQFLLLLACCILPFVFLKMMYLETKMDQEGIQIRFFPLVRRTWRWSEMTRAEIVNYGFVGGWGIRLWTQYGTVYNIRGDEGLAFELKNGKKILVGTQKQKELQNFLNPVLEKFGLS